MAFWRLGITGGFLAGAIWAPLWQLLVCVALIIGSDVQIELQMGPAFITGIIMGAFATLYKPSNTKIYFSVGILLYALLLFLCSFGEPFGSLLTDNYWRMIVSLMIISTLSFISSMCCAIGT